MCDVTCKNFEELYPQIIDDLHSATFIAIDCEFSGLFDDNFSKSLFDSPSIRFDKLQNCLESVKIIQFGLSTFTFEALNNKFSAATYNFYLKPSPIMKNERFIYQAASLEFLCKNHFNFNKVFYDGIFYLNKTHEKTALKMIESGNLLNSDNRNDIQKYCSKVAEWDVTATEGSEMRLEVTDENKIFVYMLHGEIRKRFSSLWTCFAENNVVIIKKLNRCDRLALQDEDTLKKKLFDSIIGFSKVIQEIEKLKKPLVGHNLLLDLILLYKQFYNPLPVSYKSFKSAITKIFPIVYDTKLISFKLRDMLPKGSAWNSNELSSLYSYLKEGRGALLVIYTPVVEHKREGFVDEGNFHEAGFDSYCTGFCFLKMAHIFSLWDQKKQTFLLTSLPPSSKWLMGAMDGMKNQVNLARARVKYVVLDGDDPASERPNLMYVYSRTKQPLDVSEILDLIVKHAAVDIQLLSEHSALLAAASQHQAREIRERLRDHKDFKLIKYNFLKHSKSGKRIVSGTVILSIIFVAVFVSRRWG